MSFDVIHESQGSVFPRRVFFTGDNVALAEGQGLCYERDYVGGAGHAAADGSGRRDKRVELPNTDNALAFAGVTVKSYTAVAGGQWVEIYQPGSVCEIFCPIATTVGSTNLTAGVGTGLAGAFALSGIPGRGSALALQTQANVSDTTTVGPISSSLDGTATYTNGTKTVGKTGAFANAAKGDKVLILAGMSTTGTNPATPGVYTIASKTSDDAVVLETAPAAGDGTVAFICYRGEPTILAKLLDGPESGLVDVLIGSTGAAPTIKAGGRSYLYGKATGGIAADVTLTIADAVRNADRREFVVWGTTAAGGGQKDFVITPTSSNIIRPTHAALTTFKMHTDKDNCSLLWDGIAWLLQGKGTAA